MRTLTLVLAVLLFTVQAHATEPSAVPWLLGFFAGHATPPPPCAERGACTATEQAARDEVSSLRLQTALAVVEVAYDDRETPLFRKSRDGRARTALLLATIAAHETGVQPRLARGECQPGECDGGKAVGLMQIHPGDFGIKLVGDRERLCLPAEAGSPDCITRADLLADPVLTQRVALHILRTVGLGVYAGEGACEGDVSSVIREWAGAYARRHPAPLDEDVLATLAEDAGAP